MQLNFLYSLYILKSREVHLLVLIVPFKNLIRMFHIDHLVCKEDSFNSSFPICMSPICLLHYFYYITHVFVITFIIFFVVVVITFHSG